MDIRQFSHNPHPYHLPNLMDAFSWSMPFVAQKISDIFLTILTNVADVDMLAEIYSPPTEAVNGNKNNAAFGEISGQDRLGSTFEKLTNCIIENSELKTSPLVHKIRAVAKLIRSYNLLRYFFRSCLIIRTERESIIELKALMRSDRLPYGTLALGAEGIRQGRRWQPSPPFSDFVF